ncbi:sulfotransferase [Jatrophihabitans cynanchi]|uniref:Sulfotransferase n=1 Tax=Jatrophihabitans cynanchi TaxID=2944128 RepID=A0ABY7JZE4_9ACTN|nr:sulfotransferase [Jatrophihabitans sp. SB3-54]WAX56519.1 sulfotransferase [Jatrophihabitans sp. SB3-54]
MTERISVGTIADLQASAAQLTGLSDFGDVSYRTGLTTLLDSYAEDEELTPLGCKIKRAELRGALVARLLSEAAWTQYPASADVPIERPIFVTGLPRTGTTALHRLLCADPAAQGLEQWLCEVPQPRPPRDSWPDNPIFQHIQHGFEQFHAANPEFAGVHYIAADTVEECWQLLRQSAMSISYESLAHVPGYSAWLARQNWTPAYARHRRNLQLIGLNDAGKRWVLKNPSHLFALDALLAVYPDALIVQTHRDPRVAVASSCSLSALATRGHSTRFVGGTLGADQLDLLARGAALFAASRARHDPDRFVDVQYEDLVGDPVGTVAGVYAAFGLPFDEQVRAAVTAEDAASRAGARAPAHRYTLADFGLTGADVDARFADYVATHRPAPGTMDG